MKTMLTREEMQRCWARRNLVHKQAGEVFDLIIKEAESADEMIELFSNIESSARFLRRGSEKTKFEIEIAQHLWLE